MPDTTTTWPRRLEELEIRPAPQLFARASALQLFTEEPEPVEDPGTEDDADSGAGTVGPDSGSPGSGLPGSRSGDHDREGASVPPGAGGSGRGTPTIRRCLAVAGVVAILVTGAGLSAQALTSSGKDAPATPPVPTSPATTADVTPAGTTVDWGSAGLAVGGGMTARAYFGQLDDIVSELDDTVSLHIVPGYLTSYPERCALTVVFTGVRGKEASAYAMDLGDSWPAPELAPSSEVSTDHGVVHHQMVMPPATVKAGTSWTYWSLIDVDGKQTNSGPYSLNLVKRDGSRLTWSFGGQTVTCSVY